MQAIGDFVSVNRDIVARVVDLFRGLAPKGRSTTRINTVIFRINGVEFVNPTAQCLTEYVRKLHNTTGA